MSTGRKRKTYTSSSHSSQTYSATHSDIPAGLQAHEADIVRGPQAVTAAESLEYTATSVAAGTGSSSKLPQHFKVHVGSALIRLGGDPGPGTRFHDEDDDDEPYKPPVADADPSAVWVDRFDIRLLLDPSDLPLPPPPSTRRFNVVVDDTPPSPSGWEDFEIPSRREETPEKTEEHRRKKRRQDNEKDHEKRLKAMQEVVGGEDDNVWGGSDEEPDEEQTTIMRRTAEKFADAANPAQLEMRILANHGGEKQFSFLRGRWGRAWSIAKGLARLKRQREVDDAKQKHIQIGLGTLADYGDSSDEDDGNEGGEKTQEIVGDVQASGADISQEAITLEYIDPQDVDDRKETIKEARRLRAKEWSEKRRQQAQTSDCHGTEQ